MRRDRSLSVAVRFVGPVSLNAALIQRKKEPFEFLHVEGVLAEARREAELYGAQFWKRLEEAGIIGSKSEFEAQASASAEERESLARAYLTWKGRDVASAGVDPNWARCSSRRWA